MLKNLKEFSRLKDEWKKSWKKEIADIFVFGSFVRGKEDFNDIDICLVFKEDIDIAIVKKASDLLGEKFHVSSLVMNNFFADTHSVAKTIIFEGISIINGKRFAELESNTIYSYDISKEESSKKVRFVYLLRGRPGYVGLVKSWNGNFISNNVFIAPLSKDSEIQKVFDTWKVKYKRIKMMLID